MADENKPEEKTKQTVPALVKTPKGIAEHAVAVRDMQYDKNRRAIKDPLTVFLALFVYAIYTAELLHESEQKIVRLEKRLAEFEARLTTVERFKDEALSQSAEMIKGFEEMEREGKVPAVLREVLAPALVKKEEEAPAPNGEATKNGGAA